MIGWIKLSRDISNHWIWKDETKLKWWLDILLTVNFKDNKILMGNQLVECKRGQSVMSLQQWGERWKVDKNKVRNFFVLLEKDGMILHENLSKTTRITICNYDSYQSKENDTKTESKRRRNADETQSYPIEEGKEFKEGEKGEEYTPKFIFLGELENIRIESENETVLHNRYTKQKLDFMIKKLDSWLQTKKKKCESYKSLIAYFNNWVEKDYEENKPQVKRLHNHGIPVN